MPNEKNSSIAIPKFKDEDEKLTNNKNSGSLALPIFKDKDEKSPGFFRKIHRSKKKIIIFKKNQILKKNQKSISLKIIL